MSEALHFASTTLQEVALVFMALVYTTRLIWIFKRFPVGKERQAPSGTRGTVTPRASILHSWFNVAQPWAMESSRTKLFLYFQFVIFHIGVVAAIALSFIIPYAPGLLDATALVKTIQVLCFAAFIVAVIRIFRRLGSKHMRAISTPDDHFSLALLTIWFLFAGLAAPNDVAAGETVLMIYFWLTAFFLIYVPFSKISHYLYYPFTRLYLGRTLGRRGVFPIVRG
jgi:nitrate reductase gamma subunit